jgi:hypothetical protein
MNVDRSALLLLNLAGLLSTLFVVHLINKMTGNGRKRRRK